MLTPHTFLHLELSHFSRSLAPVHIQELVLAPSQLALSTVQSIDFHVIRICDDSPGELLFPPPDHLHCIHGAPPAPLRKGNPLHAQLTGIPPPFPRLLLLASNHKHSRLLPTRPIIPI